MAEGEVIKDVITLTLSGAAFAVSLMTAARAWRYNRAALRSTSRNNYMNALFNINRELIAHPDLWAVYDPDWPQADSHNSPTEKARRRSFIWYHINLFEVFYGDYHHHRLDSPDSDDRQYWDSWDKFIRSFLQGSDEARALVSNDESMELLHREFRDYLRGCLPAGASRIGKTSRSSMMLPLRLDQPAPARPEMTFSPTGKFAPRARYWRRRRAGRRYRR
jgi:hypothetical protein